MQVSGHSQFSAVEWKSNVFEQDRFGHASDETRVNQDLQDTSWSFSEKIE